MAYFWIETKDLTLEQIDEKLLGLYSKVRYVVGVEGAEVKGSIVQTVKSILRLLGLPVNR